MNREPNTIFANFSLLFGTNETGTTYRIEAQSGGVNDLTAEERQMIIEAFAHNLESHNQENNCLLMMTSSDDEPTDILH